jgi:hypothetical protein
MTKLDSNNPCCVGWATTWKMQEWVLATESNPKPNDSTKKKFTDVSRRDEKKQMAGDSHPPLLCV